MRAGTAAAAAAVAAALAVRGAAAAEPKDPYEVREDHENVLAAETAAPPMLTLGTPFVRSATGWLLPGAGLAEKLPEFRITMDANAESLPGNIGDIERRVRGVEVLVPQSKGLWLGWELPEDGTGEAPRATFSIRSRF